MLRQCLTTDKMCHDLLNWNLNFNRFPGYFAALNQIHYNAWGILRSLYLCIVLIPVDSRSVYCILTVPRAIYVQLCCCSG